MSMRGPLASGAPQLPELPSGWPIGTYPIYAGAQSAVNYLSEAGFPIEHVTIVGNEPKLVERITGRMTARRAARGGAIAGAYWGVFLGVLMLLFSPSAASALLVVPVAVLAGMGIGTAIGLVTFRAFGGQREFTSRSQVVGSSYELVVDPGHVDEARNLLAKYALKTGAL